jgi:hypothetical protein
MKRTLPKGTPERFRKNPKFLAWIEEQRAKARADLTGRALEAQHEALHKIIADLSGIPNHYEGEEVRLCGDRLMYSTAGCVLDGDLIAAELAKDPDKAFSITLGRFKCCLAPYIAHSLGLLGLTNEDPHVYEGDLLDAEQEQQELNEMKPGAGDYFRALAEAELREELFQPSVQEAAREEAKRAFVFFSKVYASLKDNRSSEKQHRLS